MSGIIVTPPAHDFLPVATADQVKEYLKLTDVSLSPTETAFLTRMIECTTNWIELMLNRKIKTRVYTGSMDGSGGTVLYPEDAEGRHLCPITTLTSLAIDDVSLDVNDKDVVLLYGAKGYIRLLQNIFTRGFMNVDLTLTAGFITIPPVIVQGCCQLVKKKWESRDKQSQDILSWSAGGETVTFRKEDMHKETWEEMCRYRKEVFA